MILGLPFDGPGPIPRGMVLPWGQVSLALPSKKAKSLVAFALTLTGFLSLFIYYSRLLHIENYPSVQEKSLKRHSL